MDFKWGWSKIWSNAQLPPCMGPSFPEQPHSRSLPPTHNITPTKTGKRFCFMGDIPCVMVYLFMSSYVYRPFSKSLLHSCLFSLFMLSKALRQVKNYNVVLPLTAAMHRLLLWCCLHPLGHTPCSLTLICRPLFW
jgi:hypothetical protein